LSDTVAVTTPKRRSSTRVLLAVKGKALAKTARGSAGVAPENSTSKVPVKSCPL
jgi:hypothetical protein